MSPEGLEHLEFQTGQTGAGIVTYYAEVISTTSYVREAVGERSGFVRSGRT